jgi:hypothetical protein
MYIMNCVFAWLWVALCIIGFYYGSSTFGERWKAWIYLAAGWLVLAAVQTLFVFNMELDFSSTVVLWLLSYALIMLSITLLFIKVVRFKKISKRKPDDGR